MTAIEIAEWEPLDDGAYVELSIASGENVHVSTTSDLAQVTVTHPAEDMQASILIDDDGLHLKQEP